MSDRLGLELEDWCRSSDDIIGYAGPGLAFEVSCVHRVLTHALEYAHALIWEDTGTSIVSCNLECAIHDD